MFTYIYIYMYIYNISVYIYTYVCIFMNVYPVHIHPFVYTCIKIYVCVSGWFRQLQFREKSVHRELTWRKSSQFQVLGIWKMSGQSSTFALLLTEKWRKENTGKTRKNNTKVLVLSPPWSPSFLNTWNFPRFTWYSS